MTETVIQYAVKEFELALRMMAERKAIVHAFDLGTAPDGVLYSILIAIGPKGGDGVGGGGGGGVGGGGAGGGGSLQTDGRKASHPFIGGEMRPTSKRDSETVYLAEEWHEDEGCVLWYRVPVCEPPYVGSPDVIHSDGTPTTCSALIEEGYLTHWSRLPQIFEHDGYPKFPSPKAARRPV